MCGVDEEEAWLSFHACLVGFSMSQLPCYSNVITEMPKVTPLANASAEVCCLFGSSHLSPAASTKASQFNQVAKGKTNSCLTCAVTIVQDMAHVCMVTYQTLQPLGTDDSAEPWKHTVRQPRIAQQYTSI